MLIDEVKIELKAGKGGNGVVAFDKDKMALGPTGGRGGNGGDVYFQGISDLLALRRYRNQKKFQANDGKRGGTDKSDGKSGDDLILPVPVGSIIINTETKERYEITQVDEKILIARGGLGGRGNFYFRSPSNTSPEEWEEGKSGEKKKVSIELQLIADIGLIGLPSAGKSSLINELTKANVKVGAYHFTTLEPNLGALEGGLILADIPGLIEGASEGRGLGIKFLRHIQRTKKLLHCLSLESDDLKKDYQIIREELGKYDKKLLEKEEIILLTKSDLVEDKNLKSKLKIAEKLTRGKILVVSIHDWDSLENLKKELQKITKK